MGLYIVVQIVTLYH